VGRIEVSSAFNNYYVEFDGMRVLHYTKDEKGTENRQYTLSVLRDMERKNVIELEKSLWAYLYQVIKALYGESSLKFQI
jgi:hypothetical protein